MCVSMLSSIRFPLRLQNWVEGLAFVHEHLHEPRRNCCGAERKKSNTALHELLLLAEIKAQPHLQLTATLNAVVGHLPDDLREVVQDVTCFRAFFGSFNVHLDAFRMF